MVTLGMIAYLASITHRLDFDEENITKYFEVEQLKKAQINRLLQYIRAFKKIQKKLSGLMSQVNEAEIQKIVLSIAKASLKIDWTDKHWKTFSWFCVFCLQAEYNNLRMTVTKQRRIHSVVHILAIGWLISIGKEENTWNLSPLNISECFALKEAIRNGNSEKLGFGIKKVFNRLHDCSLISKQVNPKTESKRDSIASAVNSHAVVLREKQRRKDKRIQFLLNTFAIQILGVIILILFGLLFLISKDSYQNGIAVWHSIFGAFIANMFILIFAFTTQRMLLRYV